MKSIAHSLCGEAGVSQVEEVVSVSPLISLDILVHMYAGKGLQLVWYTVEVHYEVGLLRCWSWQIFSSTDE